MHLMNNEHAADVLLQSVTLDPPGELETNFKYPGP
jgi:hypothetical protein